MLGRLGLTGFMNKMSAVLRIKAELALVAASRKLLGQHASVRTSPETRAYADTTTVVRKELDKLVGILADDASEKHWNVAARVAKCADYLAQIPSREVQDARLDMICAHKVLQDVEEITF
jgi:ribosome-binding factor A